MILAMIVEIIGLLLANSMGISTLIGLYQEEEYGGFIIVLLLFVFTDLVLSSLLVFTVL